MKLFCRCYIRKYLVYILYGESFLHPKENTEVIFFTLLEVWNIVNSHLYSKTAKQSIQPLFIILKMKPNSDIYLTILTLKYTDLYTKTEVKSLFKK